MISLLLCFSVVFLIQQLNTLMFSRAKYRCGLLILLASALHIYCLNFIPVRFGSFLLSKHAVFVDCTSESQNLLHRREKEKQRTLIFLSPAFMKHFEIFIVFCKISVSDFSPGKNIHSVNTLTFSHLSFLCLTNVTFLQFFF